MVVSVTVAAPPPSSTPAGGLYLTRLRSLSVESASEHGCGGIRTQVEEGLNMVRRLDFHGTVQHLQSHRLTPLFFWVNADTQPMNPAKSQLYWASWCQDTEAGLPCASSCAQP